MDAANEADLVALEEARINTPAEARIVRMMGEFNDRHRAWKDRDGRMDLGEVARILNEVHQSISRSGSGADIVSQISNAQRDRFLHALGISDQQIAQADHTNFNSGLAKPIPSTVLNLFSYVGSPLMAFANPAGPLATAVSVAVLGPALNAVLQTSMEGLTANEKARGSFQTKVPPESINYNYTWVPQQVAKVEASEVEFLRSSDAVHGLLDRIKAENPGATWAALTPDRALDDKDFLAAVRRSTYRETFCAAVADLVRSHKSLETELGNLLMGEGTSHRQATAHRMQTGVRGTRSALSTAGGLASYAADPADRKQLIANSAISQGLLASLNAGLSFVTAMADEVQKQRHLDKEVMAFALSSLLKPDIQEKKINNAGKLRDGEELKENDFDKEALLKLHESPEQFYIKEATKRLDVIINPFEKITRELSENIEDLTTRISGHEADLIEKGIDPQGATDGLNPGDAKTHSDLHRLRAELSDKKKNLTDMNERLSEHQRKNFSEIAQASAERDRIADGNFDALTSGVLPRMLAADQAGIIETILKLGTIADSTWAPAMVNTYSKQEILDQLTQRYGQAALGGPLGPIVQQWFNRALIYSGVVDTLPVRGALTLTTLIPSLISAAYYSKGITAKTQNRADVASGEGSNHGRQLWRTVGGPFPDMANKAGGLVGSALKAVGVQTAPNWASDKEIRVRTEGFGLLDEHQAFLDNVSRIAQDLEGPHEAV